MQPSRFFLSAVVAAFGVGAFAQGGSMSERYSKYEYMIAMRDGVKLYTQVYVPKGAPGKHPILLERTCYGAGPKGPTAFKAPRGSRKLQDAGYIFAYQDVRGKGASEGDFVNVRPQLKPGEKGIDESTDTYDAVDYLVKNVPDNNGKVGLWGISYPGFYAGVGGINSHPNLAAISPQAPVSDWFVGDDVHHNGAFFLEDNFNFSSGFDVPRGGPRPQIDRQGKSAYDFFLDTGALGDFDRKHYKGLIPYWNELMQHETYDAYWKDRALPPHMKNVKCAVLVVGGMFDAEDMWGALNLYQYVGRQNPGTPNFIVMGPWFHGGWAGGTGRKFGDVDFGAEISTGYREDIEFPFFEKYLRDQNVATPPKARIFETGTNVWKSFAQWPPKMTAKTEWFLDTNHTLRPAKPTLASLDAYEYDPAAPTPYLGNYKTSQRRPTTYMIDDQRWASERADVLTYTGPVLDAKLTVCGPVDVDFWVSTTGTDGDFVVKLIDVYPKDAQGEARDGKPMAGYQQMLRWDVMRGRFRNSLERPEPFTPGKPTRLHFKLNEVLHTFLPGHRLMVQVQSAMFPLVDRHPNKFVSLANAKPEDFQKATITVFHSPTFPSKVSVGVLSNKD